MMNNFQTFRSGPRATSKSVKWTIATTLIVTFFSLIFNALFTQVFRIPSPQYLLSLTTWGIHKFFIWQFLSYLFVQNLTREGISMTLILYIFFDLYLLWTIGSSVIQVRGEKHFIGLYFGGALFVGVIAYLCLFLVGSPLPFTGATTSIYILLIGWTFLFPETSIMFLLMFPVRAKWLVFGFIGVNLFLDFSNGNFLLFFVTLAAMVYGYFYSLLVWEILSPFQYFHEMERRMIYLKRKVRHKFKTMGDIIELHSSKPEE